jgi:hypothetical protein
VLDSGAVLGAAQGNRRARAAIRVAREHGDELVVPAVVIAEVVRGRDPTNAHVGRVLKAEHHHGPAVALPRCSSGRPSSVP